MRLQVLLSFSVPAFLAALCWFQPCGKGSALPSSLPGAHLSFPGSSILDNKSLLAAFHPQRIPCPRYQGGTQCWSHLPASPWPSARVLMSQFLHSGPGQHNHSVQPPEEARQCRQHRYAFHILHSEWVVPKGSVFTVTSR